MFAFRIFTNCMVRNFTCSYFSIFLYIIFKIFIIYKKYNFAFVQIFSLGEKIQQQLLQYLKKNFQRFIKCAKICILHLCKLAYLIKNNLQLNELSFLQCIAEKANFNLNKYLEKYINSFLRQLLQHLFNLPAVLLLQSANNNKRKIHDYLMIRCNQYVHICTCT